MQSLRAGELLANRYRLIQPLAHGGMGSVWVAEHTHLKTRVAVKVISDALRADPTLRARFEREALASAQLKSPHIVAVQDFDFDGDTPFMVMELLEGEDLARRIQRSGAMAPRDVLAIAIPIAKALTKAHAARVVHRDLKPANIFVARTDDGEVVKVVDFGIAKMPHLAGQGSDDPTSTDSIVGSPTYMSPEQVRTARDVDHRADLWAFAVILFRLLTNAVPFSGHTHGDLLVNICTEAPRTISSVAPHLPPRLDAFFARALDKDPAQRFQSAHELTNSFAQAMGQPPPFAAPTARGSLPSLEPPPSQPGARPPVFVEHAQSLATNNIGPRKPAGLSPSTIALASAPALVLAVIAILAIRSSSEQLEPQRDATAASSTPATVETTPPQPVVAPTSSSAEPTAASEASASATPSASTSPAPNASAQSSGARPQPARPQPAPGRPGKDRIRLGL